MTAKEVLNAYDSAENETVILSIEGVSKAQEISVDAAPLLKGIMDMHVAFMWIDKGKLALKLEYDERPF